MGRTSLNIFNNLNESFEEEFRNTRNPKNSVKKLVESKKEEKRKAIKEEAKARAKERYAFLKENDWTVTYIPDKTKKDQTATISVSAVNKSDAVNKARQTIGQDCPITLVQPLQETDKVEVDEDGNKSIRDEKTGHLKRIQVSKKTQDKMADEHNKKLDEDDVIEIPLTDDEPDYIIEDVTELNVVGDGDIQAPDIEGLLTLVDESLRNTYGDKWGHIRILSSNRMNESSCYALVDISTPEIIKEFETRGIQDAAVGKNLILENTNGKITFKVNSLNGSTKFSKVTENAEATIKEWIETEYLHEAMIEKFEEENQKKEKELKDIVENYIANRPDLKMEIANIEMFIELAKNDDSIKNMLQDRMYGLAAEIPNTIKVKVDEDNKTEMSFGSLDEVVELLFGKQYVKEVSEDNKVIGVVKESEEVEALWKYIDSKPNLHYLKDLKNPQEVSDSINIEAKKDKELAKLAGLKESYQQFNIGEIDVVFNPDTYECLYSIPSADVKDKKINLSEIPSVETPYDTNTIIKDYVEKNYGRIPSENDNLDNGTEEQKSKDEVEVEVKDEAPTPVDDVTTDVDLDAENVEVEEAELPQEPGEDEEISAEEVEVEEPVDEVPEEKKAETGSAVFVKIRPKQPAALEDIRERLLDGDTPKANFIVVDEKDLTDEEWNNLTENLTSPESYLVGIEAIDRKNYSFNVIKLKNSNANYNLLVDPLGYDYPRYIAIQDK